MKKNLSKIYLAIIFFIMYLPLAVMFIFSFNDSKSTSIFTGFSLKWYVEMINDTAAMDALKNTLVLALLTTVVATILGTAAAVGVFGMRNKWFKTGVLTVTNIPMMNPDIVTGVSLMFLFAFIGRALGAVESLNFVTLLIAHVTFSLPYVVLNVLPKLTQLDGHLAEAAQDLGSTPIHAFFHVVLPSIVPGIISGAIMSFTLSLDDFVISHYTSGSYNTLPLLIYSMTKKRVTPEMYAVCSCIFLTVLVLLVVMNISQIRQARAESEKKKDKKGKWIKFVAVGAALAVIIASVSIFGLKGNDSEELVLEGIYTQDLKGTTLKVYNWGEYISDGADGTIDVNKEFEKLTGIKVEYSNFDDNEMLYSSLASGATYYDVIIPSDYIIDRLVKEGRLMELDHSQLTNYKYIDEKYQNLYFDPDNKYSVPYNVGLVGLIYNSKLMDEPPTGWSSMWDEQYKGEILMFNNPRDSFAIAQFRLGQDINNEDVDQWNKAADLLKKQKPLVQNYVMDEVFNKMENNNAIMAPYYAGDYLSMAEINPDLKFIYPEEGTNIFCDSMCVPANSENPEAAMMYINFMLEPAIALANAEYICYASPNTSVIDNDEYTFKDNEILYPDESVTSNTQWFHNLDDKMLSYYEALWVDIKNS